MPKVYLITGARRGIGNAVLQVIAKRPDTVVLAGIRGDVSTLNEETQELVRNGKVIPLRLAAGDVAGTQAAVEQVKAQFGKVDVLILNAAVNETPRNTSILNIEPECITKHTEVNTYGPLRVVQAFAPLLKASSNPQLVNITASASSMGNYPNVPIQPYAASKATLNFLLVALAAEEPWLKVQHIHPGVVMTDMFKPALEEFKFSEEQLKQMGVITPAQSAEGIVNHIDSERHVQGMLDASVGKEQAMILF